MTHKIKAFPAKFATVDEKAGRVEALVSIFGNVDLVGDRVVKGAFQKSIQKWKASRDPIPVVMSHDWGDPWKHLGVVDDIQETTEGLKATYTLDVEDNPVAKQVYKLMKRRSLKEHSFAYDIIREKSAKDGANELLEVDIIEVGPTFKGVNPDTELLAVKSVVESQEQPQKTPPWHIEEDNADCDGFAVVADETDKVVGCHETRAAAQAQIDALYANVDDADKSDVEKHAEFFAEHTVKAGRFISKATASDIQSAMTDFQNGIEILQRVLSKAAEAESEEEKLTEPEEEKPEVKGEDRENGKPSDDVLLRLKAQIARYQNQEV